MREGLLNLVQRVAALAVERVDKGDDRRIAQSQTSKSLRVCSSMPPWRLWGGVEHLHRVVDRGQGAEGVLAKIPVG
jgi:hypothetical protein